MATTSHAAHLVDGDGHPARRVVERNLKMTLMKKALLAASAGILVAPVVALAAPTVGDSVGTSLEEVMNNLTNSGCEVREIEAEDDELEAVVLVDGQLLELEISPETGMILSVELEEDDGEDDDDDMGN
jgi:hypothetical protein